MFVVIKHLFFLQEPSDVNYADLIEMPTDFLVKRSKVHLRKQKQIKKAVVIFCLVLKSHQKPVILDNLCL